MKVNQFKTNATLSSGGATTPGLAHVIEIVYNERINFCNFVMEIAESESLGSIKPDQFFLLRLEDGREAAVSIGHLHGTAGYLEVAGSGHFQKRTV